MAQTTLQNYIDATQLEETLKYGLRAIDAAGGAHYCTGPLGRQLTEARAAAGELFGRVGPVPVDNGTKSLLQYARKLAKAQLDEAKAELKALGGIRQRRLALAEAA